MLIGSAGLRRKDAYKQQKTSRIKARLQSHIFSTVSFKVWHECQQTIIVCPEIYHIEHKHGEVKYNKIKN